jgi:hypothetical protein
MEGLLNINAGAEANLSTFDHTARALTINTAGQGPNTYGSSGSTAAVQDDTYFTDPQPGILTVTGRAFFSRANGDWNTAATWSNSTYGGAAGTLTPGAADVVNIGGGNYAITVGANSFCYSLAYQPNTTNDPTLTINAGTLTVSGSINIPSGGGLFGAGVNTLAVGAGSLVAGSLEFSTGGLFGGHVLTIGTGTATINGDVTQSFPNATISFSGAGNLRLFGAFLNSTQCTFTAGTGTVHYLSTTEAQTIGDFTYNNLILNNTTGVAPQLTLYDDATVSGALTMTSGIINLNSATLRLGTAVTSAATIGSLNYVSGWMYGGTFRRYFNENIAVTVGSVAGLFPLGTNSDYRPFYLGKPVLANTGGALNVSHDGTDNSSVGVNFPDDIGTISVRSNSFWTVSKALGMAGSGTPYSIQAGGTGFGIVEEVDDLRLSQASSEVGSTSLPNAGTTASPLVNKISISNANLAQNYYIASVDPDNTPLPIELLYFHANLQNDVVNLEWSTAAELNNDYFTIERATDIEKFEILGDPIRGQGTTNERNDYSVVDDAPVYGRSYYRLKQTDFDGKFTYSDVRVVDYEGPKFASLRAYPNPSNGSQLTVLVTGLKEQTVVPLQIYNVQGQLVYQGTFDVDNPGTLKKELEFASPLRSGIYLIKAGQTLQLTQKIFIE